MQNIFRRLRFSSCGAPSLTKRLICKLSIQLLLGLASAVALRSKSRRTRGHILLSHSILSSLYVFSYVSLGGGVNSRYITSGYTQQKTHLSTATCITCPLLYRALAMARLSLCGLGVDQAENTSTDICICVLLRCYLAMGFCYDSIHPVL
jgi:hypothetical protein